MEYPQWFIEELARDKDKKRAVKGEVRGSETLRFLCKKHGMYVQTVSDHIRMKDGVRKKGCPLCALGNHQSLMEKEIGDYLTSIGIRYETNVRGVITLNGRNYELDIYCPNARIGIEVNGSYWHGSLGNLDSTKKSPTYHQEKVIAAEKNNVHLIQIFDVDWLYSRSRVEMLLRGAFLPKKKVYARKTRVRWVSDKVAKDFYERYHYQGSSKHCTQNIGLYQGSELISCMGFGKTRYGDFGTELHRYCVAEGYVIVGGADKLFKTYCTRYKPDGIVAYSDMDLFTGGIYHYLGFRFDGYIKPRYYWTNSRMEVRTHEQCSPKRLKKEYSILYEEATGNKEDYIMSRLGWVKVYRSGDKRWIYQR